MCAFVWRMTPNAERRRDLCLRGADPGRKSQCRTAGRHSPDLPRGGLDAAALRPGGGRAEDAGCGAHPSAEGNQRTQCAGSIGGVLMAPKLRLSVPNGENDRKNGTFSCRGRFPAERAGFAEGEREKREKWPFGAVSHSVTSRELVWQVPACRRGGRRHFNGLRPLTPGKEDVWNPEPPVSTPA